MDDQAVQAANGHLWHTWKVGLMRKTEFDKSSRITATVVYLDINLHWKSWNHAISIKDKRRCAAFSEFWTKSWINEELNKRSHLAFCLDFFFFCIHKPLQHHHWLSLLIFPPPFIHTDNDIFLMKYAKYVIYSNRVIRPVNCDDWMEGN